MEEGGDFGRLCREAYEAPPGVCHCGVHDLGIEIPGDLCASRIEEPYPEIAHGREGTVRVQLALGGGELHQMPCACNRTDMFRFQDRIAQGNRGRERQDRRSVGGLIVG